MLERTLSYIRDFYIEFQQPGAVMLDPVMLLCMIISINDLRFEKKAFKTAVLHLLIFWPLLILLKGMRYQTTFLVTYVYLFVTLAYTVIFGRKHMWSNSVYFMVIWAGYYYSSSFIKALAGIVIEDLLGFKLTNGAVQIFMIPMLFTYFSAVTIMIKKLSLRKYDKPTVTGVTFVTLVLILSICAKNYLVDTLVNNTEVETIAMLDSRQFIVYMGILLYVLLFISYVYCYNSTKGYYENLNVLSEVRRVIGHNSELETQQKMLQQNIEEMRYIKHDLKNQMAYLQIMLAQKDYGRLEEYLAEYNRDIALSVAVADCGNVVVRNILALEQAKAKQNHIAIDHKIAIQEDVSVSNTDLTAILINLLDNAIEACISDEIKGAVIELHIRQSEHYLYINVSNPLSDRDKYAKRRALSTFKDKSIHGNGTKIVNRIAEKYNGAFSHELENDRFVVDVMLALE